MGERWKVPVKSNKDLIETAFEQIEKETGFKISRHRMIFEGLCPECSENK